MTEIKKNLRAALPKACQDAGGTAAFLEHVLDMVLPLVCQQTSKGMCEDPGQTILLNEEEIKEGEYADVIRQIGLTIENIKIVDVPTLTSDMEKYPTFEWPEKDRYRDLMSSDGMTVLDIDNLTLKICLGKGIEFSVPVTNTFGMPVTLEVGCGGRVIGDDAYFELCLPKVRAWVVINEQKQNFVSRHKHVYSKVYVAFIGRPNLTPNVHINADRGKGDFFEMDLHESGSLDDIVENVILGFGPKEYYDQNPAPKHEKAKESWVGNALGKQLSKALGRFVELGHNKPYVLDLTDTMTQSFSGKPRQVKDIQANMAQLQAELEVAQAYYDAHPDEVIEAEEEEK